MKTIAYSKFLGVNTKLPITSLTVKDRTGVKRWLADAVNVDIDNDGSILRRVGTERVATVTAPHSLFQDMIVRAGVLYRFTMPYAETMLRLLAENDRMSYAKIGGQVFMSNGTDALRVDCNGEIVPWALPAPAAPTLAPISGEMSPGRYMVSIAYSNCEEIGCMSEATVVESIGALEGGVRVTLPGAVEGATHIKVYISGNDGNVPMLHSDVEIGTPSLDIVTAPTGHEGSRQIEAPLPAGSRIFEYNGRLCSVNGKALYIGQPYRHGYYLPLSGVIPFHDDITAASPVEDGIYVAAGDKTVFVPGIAIEGSTMGGANLGGGEGVLKDVFEFGAVPWTEFGHPTKPISGWFSAKGIVLAGPAGEAKLMMENIAFTPPSDGVSLLLDDGRLERVVSCGYAMNLETGAVTRYTGFDFSSKNDTIFCSATGLFELGDEQVAAQIDLGAEDFERENEKAMPATYLSASSAEPLNLTVEKMDGAAYSYPARTSSDTLGVHRVDPGLGLRDNWFRLKVSNNGDEFKLASVSFAPVASSRRI